MSDALRPSSLFTSAAPATAPSGVLATLPNPPPEVSQLPAGTTLRGTVVGHDDQGHLLVRTDLGTLAVATKANPPAGSDVVLQIRASGAQLHVLLMLSEPAAGGGSAAGSAPGSGRGAAASGGASGAGSGGAPAIPAAGSAQVPDRLTFGNDIRAILQAPVPTGIGPAGMAKTLAPALTAALARLAPGSPLILRITAINGPAGGPAQAGASTGLGPAPGPGGGPGAADAPAGLPAPSTALLARTAPGAGPFLAGAPDTAGGQPGGAPALTPGPAQAAPGAPQGQAATSAVPSPASPSPATAPAPPGTGMASGALAPASIAPGIAPDTTPGSAQWAAIPPGVRSAASAAGAAYGVAGQAQPGTPPAPGEPAAPTATAPMPTPSAAPQMPGTAGTGRAQAHGPAAAGAHPAANSLTGTVTATTKAGQPVLQTPIGTLTLEARATLPVGSQVTFRLSPESLPRGATGLSLESDALPSSLARAWPEIEAAVRVLHDTAPAALSGSPGDSALPQPGPRLASGLLFFLAALSGGDVNRWLGDRGAQALKDAGRGNLLARLGQDFGQLSRHVDSGGGDWRMFLIPMLDGHQVQQIRFFERHGSHRRGGGESRDGESTHFILEVELTRLGDMQIDGLVRARRFDLMLRTHRPLPEAMRHRITEIFNEANEIAGYAGTIGFQASRDWRFMPVAAEAVAAGTGLVI